jgi:hypothetical protein
VAFEALGINGVKQRNTRYTGGVTALEAEFGAYEPAWLDWEGARGYCEQIPSGGLPHAAPAEADTAAAVKHDTKSRYARYTGVECALTYSLK